MVAVRHGEVEVVQGDHVGGRQARNEVQQVKLVLNVEVVGGFVQEELSGLLGEGAGYLGALAFATGQGVP